MRFGAVAVAMPAGPGGLARLLIQEFQHVKLGAVLDLYDLYDRPTTASFPCPWGEGKARIEALLQGAYAHLAMTDFWRVSQERHGRPGGGCGQAPVPRMRCARPREAIGTLLDSGALTPLGTRFVQQMRGTASAFYPDSRRMVPDTAADQPVLPCLRRSGPPKVPSGNRQKSLISSFRLGALE